MAADLVPTCPCGRPARVDACCGRWHAGPLHLQAPDAEALMRSRYSAFVLERRDYLLDTWHPDTRPADLAFEPGLQWLGLEIRQVTPLDADHAQVEFVARNKQGGRAHRLHETSRFERRDGRWLYVDGVLHEPRSAARRGSYPLGGTGRRPQGAG